MSTNRMNTLSISEHLVNVYLAVKRREGWFTSKAISEKAKVSDRTARAHCRRLVDAGIFEEAQVFPGHRYRMTPAIDQADTGLVARIEEACGVFGFDSEPTVK